MSFVTRALPACLIALVLGGCAGPGAPAAVSPTTGLLRGKAQRGPSLVGITLRDKAVTTYQGVTGEPVSFVAKVANPTGEAVQYRWHTDGQYLGWPDRPIYTFIAFRPQAYTLHCELLGADGLVLDTRQVALKLDPAPPPPDRKVQKE